MMGGAAGATRLEPHRQVVTQAVGSRHYLVKKLEVVDLSSESDSLGIRKAKHEDKELEQRREYDKEGKPVNLLSKT